MGWRKVTSDTEGGKMLSTMVNSTASAESDTSTMPAENLYFAREVGPFLYLSALYTVF